MKVTVTAPGSRWSGNPAREIGAAWLPGLVAWPRHVRSRVLRQGFPRLRSLPGLLLAGTASVLVALQVGRAAFGLLATASEVRLVDAAFAALRSPVPAPASVRLDELVARVQLSTYALLTGAFDRYASVVTGAREAALVAGAVLLVSVLALARSLGVRGVAVAAVLVGLAVCAPAVTVLATFGPGLLGAAWLAAGAALFTRRRPWLRVLGVPSVVVGVVSAPVLAVPVLVIGAVVLVAVRLRRGALLLGVAVVATSVPLALLPPPGGAAALPVLVVACVLVGFVLVDEAVAWLAVRPRAVRGGALVAGAAAGAVALAVVPVPGAVSPTAPPLAAAPELAAWLGSATEPTTGVVVPSGVWADLVRAGVPAERLAPDGALAVTVGVPGSGRALARFGEGPAALYVNAARPEPDGAPAELAAWVSAGVLLAHDSNLDAPEAVREALRAGAVDPRAVAVLVGLADRGRITVMDVPVVPGEDPALPRHRVVLADLGAEARAWVTAQQKPYAPIMVESVDAVTTTLTWPLPA
jgi:hypothetical protein